MLMKPALLVQDIQNVWLYEPDSNQELRKSVEKRLDVINQAIAWFRGNKLPVIVGYTGTRNRDCCLALNHSKFRRRSMYERPTSRSRSTMRTLSPILGWEPCSGMKDATL